MEARSFGGDDQHVNASKDMPEGNDRDMVRFMEEAIPEDHQAALLIRQVITFTATYDHIVDEDEYTTDQVHVMVNVLLHGMPLNGFYVKYLAVLLPIILNAIHAWRYADTCPEYRIKVSDVLSELGCSMLYLSGGMSRLNEHGNHWRDLTLNLLKASDTRGK